MIISWWVGFPQNEYVGNCIEKAQLPRSVKNTASLTEQKREAPTPPHPFQHTQTDTPLSAPGGLSQKPLNSLYFPKEAVWGIG